MHPHRFHRVLPHRRMKKVSKPRERSNVKDRVEAYKELVQGDFEFFTRLTLIQQLISSVLMAVEQILQEEVTHLAREPHNRGRTRQRGVATAL